MAKKKSTLTGKDLQSISILVSILAIIIAMISAINSMVSMRLIVYNQLSPTNNKLFFAAIISLLAVMLGFVIYMAITIFQINSKTSQQIQQSNSNHSAQIQQRNSKHKRNIQQ